MIHEAKSASRPTTTAASILAARMPTNLYDPPKEAE
jgi:hypothetical protein